MPHIRASIRGVPYSQSKGRGNKSAPEKWSKEVIEQTRNLPLISEACVLRVTFRLPSNKFPKDFRYGPDLDNLLKRLLDALGETVFSKAHGGDSCVIALEAMKVLDDEHPGVDIEILPISID